MMRNFRRPEHDPYRREYRGDHYWRFDPSRDRVQARREVHERFDYYQNQPRDYDREVRPPQDYLRGYSGYHNYGHGRKVHHDEFHSPPSQEYYERFDHDVRQELPMWERRRVNWNGEIDGSDEMKRYDREALGANRAYANNYNRVFQRSKRFRNDDWNKMMRWGW